MPDKLNQLPEDRPAAEDVQNMSAALVAANRKTRLSGLFIFLLVVVLLGAFFYIKSTAQKNSGPTSDLHIATTSRKPVPELKPVAPVAQVPPPVAPPPPTPTPTLDPLQLLRDQQELQRAEKARLLLEARLKSALDPGEGTTNSIVGKLTGTALNAVGAEGGSPDVLNPGNNPGNNPVLAEEQTGFNKNDKNLLFANSSSGKGVPSSQARAVSDPEYKILQGKFIEAITVPRAISDLPGMICALTQRDVYAERGRLILIPWGSRLCGVYNAELRKGQERLFAIWNTLRVVRADGSVTEVQLDSDASDQLGTAGMGGLVDTHFAQIFGISALLSIFGAGAANMGPSGPDQNLSAAQYRLSVQQAAAQTAQSVLAPYVGIPPTVTVPAGSRIRILVNRDLDFSSIYRKEALADKSGFEM